ncbi:MAG: DUF192 domain-containing protein [Thiobacillus sp.]|nr:DUF192 domain-containing protein [Thiobacillus sp.]
MSIPFVVSLSIPFVVSLSNHERNRLDRHLGIPLAVLLAASSLATAADLPLPQLKLQVGSHTIQAEVANTPQLREIGLMGRTHLDSDAGMLFIFEQKATHCFWMRNTLVPLSIAFLADDGTIIDIQDMQPQTLTFHCPRGPIRYALEVPQGGFRSKGIQLGMQVSGGPFGTPP